MQDLQLVSLTWTLICEIIRERKTEKCWTSGAGVGCDAPQYRPPRPLLMFDWRGDGGGGVMVSPFSTRPPLTVRRSTAVLRVVECWVLLRQAESALSPSRPRPCCQCHCSTVVLARRVDYLYFTTSYFPPKIQVCDTSRVRSSPITCLNWN